MYVSFYIYIFYVWTDNNIHELLKYIQNRWSVSLSKLSTITCKTLYDQSVFESALRNLNPLFVEALESRDLRKIAVVQTHSTIQTSSYKPLHGSNFLNAVAGHARRIERSRDTHSPAAIYILMLSGGNGGKSIKVSCVWKLNTRC